MYGPASSNMSNYMYVTIQALHVCMFCMHGMQMSRHILCVCMLVPRPGRAFSVPAPGITSPLIPQFQRSCKVNIVYLHIVYVCMQIGQKSKQICVRVLYIQGGPKKPHNDKLIVL